MFILKNINWHYREMMEVRKSVSASEKKGSPREKSDRNCCVYHVIGHLFLSSYVQDQVIGQVVCKSCNILICSLCLRSCLINQTSYCVRTIRSNEWRKR